MLGDRLKDMQLDDPVVVALPRGGVPVASEVATALSAPLDILLVRKLGAPGNPELGIGALSEDGAVVRDNEAIRRLGVTRGQLESEIRRASTELERRRSMYRAHLEPVNVAARTVVIVDDGLATGITATAAVRLMHARRATRVIVAVPVCPADSVAMLRAQLGELVCLERPVDFGGVGAWYHDFTQTSDDELIALLDANRAQPK
jgi:putative phosphoribosyl transferase